jgi:4-aminobutyrate aminotransferase
MCDVDLTDKSPRIIVTPPGSKTRELLVRDDKVLSHSMKRYYPLAIESGKGCIIRDLDGNEYIDFNSGIACLNVGHCHPKVVEAIKRQSEKFLHYSYADFYYNEIVELAEQLCKIAPGQFEKKVFFCNSGTEATEAAIKLSKWYTRKHLFLACIGAFHGRTLGALSLTASKPVHRRHFLPSLGVEHVPYPYCYRCAFRLTYPECNLWCVDYIDEYVLQKYLPPEDVASFFIEPIQGEDGYVVPPDDYFRRLKKLLDKHDLLLVDDEVQTGMGRTGRWFAIEHFQTVPDMMLIAKSIAGGLPLGALVAKSEIMDWESGSHATTFGGNPVACAAGLEVIRAMRDEHMLENAARQGNHIMKRFREMQQTCDVIGDVRGKGLMIGVEIVDDRKTKVFGREKATEIMLKSWKRGVAVVLCGQSTLRLAPPLIITRDQVDVAVDIIEGAIKEVSKT